MATRTDILSDIPGKPGRFWGDHTTLVGPVRPPAWLVRFLGNGWAHNLTGMTAAVRMLLRRHRCQAVVTDGGASGLVFALLQGLCPWGHKPHVMIDCNWYLPRGSLRTWLKSLKLRLAARTVHGFVVWASHEVKDYARAFSLPAEKLTYVPFHTTLHDYQYEVRDDGYIFAGGNYDRDYVTLIEAVRPLDVPTWIATTRTQQLDGISIPTHVRVQGTSHAGFRQAMAGARVVVVPMQKDLLHSGGQQTCLNSMYMGKPTIAIGRRWAVDFITDGENGLIVDYEDVAGLRAAIRWVLDDPQAARQMAQRGQAHAARFTTERCMRAIYDLVHGAAPAPCISRPLAPEYPNDVGTTGNAA
jgi:glycosyltransferase involved in cell wall biosynthesis